MPKFRVGAVVKFTDQQYAVQECVSKYYNKECVVLGYPNGFSNKDPLVRVKFWDGYIFTAYERRFTLSGYLGKSALEVKIDQMWNRQPYMQRKENAIHE